MHVIVTGATGFIGSAFIRSVFGHFSRIAPLVQGWRITGLTSGQNPTHSRRLNSPGVVKATIDGRFKLVSGDLVSGNISGLCEGADAVVHFAAKTFVDHSIRDPRRFVDVNVGGTFNLLEDALSHKVKRYIQVSTDEVYGQILTGAYKEDAPHNPRNPYAATKAAADDLAISYVHAYGLHTTVTRTENNYGFWQASQKAMPTFIRKCIQREPLPIYGDGHHVRQWLWVDDHVEALVGLLHKEDRNPGEVYHVAGNEETTNLALASAISQKFIDKGHFQEHNFKHIPDHDIRPGHDRRYALDSSKIKAEIGWQPTISLTEGVGLMVDWYESERAWLGL